MSLSGPWRFRADPDDVGQGEEWWTASIDEWRECPVPAAWQTWLGADYHGVGWYARDVEIPAQWIQRVIRLRFDAVATESRVWINRREIGAHVGDYVPFEFNITDQVEPGNPCRIVIRVDELPGHITKGFHDLLSIHHGGIWQPAHLLSSGVTYAAPDGIAIAADSTGSTIDVGVECAGAGDDAWIEVQIDDADGGTAAMGGGLIDADGVASVQLETEPLALWSPESPTLHTAGVTLHDAGGVSEFHSVRFGVRDVRTDESHILLNGRPLHLRGVLHWGHEPRHMSPAPPPEQVREEFARLRESGFNCVCLCMWYPPRHFFEIADETGMLIWQEHPVWQSAMDDEHIPEYKRLFRRFMKRDRSHPSVVIVSATCEHPEFHPELAQCWWDEAKQTLPGTLHQVQTASFAWSRPDQTDLYDEHTYDNNNRWPCYLADLQETLATLPPKPFVMGESIVFSSWPDVEAIQAEVGDTRPWWLTKRFDDCRRWENIWRDRYGESTLSRFRRQGDRHHLLGRQFQIEQFRSYSNHAGLVMNHLRDVAECTCGFIDDLDRWRFLPEQTRGWLGDAVLILQTPGHRRSFVAGERVDAVMALSNFSADSINGVVRCTLTWKGTGGAIESTTIETPILCAPGEVVEVPITLKIPDAPAPLRVQIRAAIDGVTANEWTLWVFPRVDFSILAKRGAFRLAGLPFLPEDAEPDEIEAGYSRGFGLPVKTWINRLPDPGELAPDLPEWPHDARPAGDVKLPGVIVTHKLTDEIRRFVEAGGAAVVLASKTAGSPPTQYEWLFGQTPLVIEEGPVDTGASDWIVDLLGFDLTRTYARVMPVEDAEAAHIDPLIRLVYTHNQEQVAFFDQLRLERHGDGVMIISSLDHHDPAGQWLLYRMIGFLADQVTS